MVYLLIHEHDIATWYPNDFHTLCYTTLIRKLDCCAANKYARFKNAAQVLGLDSVKNVGIEAAVCITKMVPHARQLEVVNLITTESRLLGHPMSRLSAMAAIRNIIPSTPRTPQLSRATLLHRLVTQSKYIDALKKQIRELGAKPITVNYLHHKGGGLHLSRSVFLTSLGTLG